MELSRHFDRIAVSQTLSTICHDESTGSQQLGHRRILPGHGEVWKGKRETPLGSVDGIAAT